MRKYPVWMPALVGALIASALGVLAISISVLPKPGQPRPFQGAKADVVSGMTVEQSVAALSAAVVARDPDAMMTYIDFDALFEDVYRKNLAEKYGVDPMDAQISKFYAGLPAYVRGAAKQDFVGLFGSEEREDEEVPPGTLPDLLKRLSDGRLNRVGDASATLEFGGGQSLLLARAADGSVWRINGFTTNTAILGENAEKLEQKVNDIIVEGIAETAKAQEQAAKNTAQ